MKKLALSLFFISFLTSTTILVADLPLSKIQKPAQAQACQDGDGVCPEGCNLENDSDCIGFYGYETHPNFWPIGEYSRTGKKYKRVLNGPDPGFDFIWVSSGPHKSGKRFLFYQKYYLEEGFGDYHEWELWTGKEFNHDAVVHKFGGISEFSSKESFTTEQECELGNTGVAWPNLEYGEKFEFTPYSMKIEDDCKPHWVSAENPGRYIAIKIEELWGNAGSDERIEKCNQYIPADNVPVGNFICRNSLMTGIVYQRYGSTNRGGCEATVYAWGNPKIEENYFREWFRNGELRWSFYLSEYYPGGVPAPDDDSWWNAVCQKAWDEKANWLYSGTYKLDNTKYVDGCRDGDGICPEGCTADSDDDCILSDKDVKFILSRWGTNDTEADLNGDRLVNGVDFGEMLLLTQ